MSHRAVVVTTLEATIAFLDPGAEALYGVSAADAVAQPLAALIGAPNAGMTRALTEAAQGRPVDDLADTHQTAAGPVAVHVSTWPLRGMSEHTGLVLLMVDARPFASANASVTGTHHGDARASGEDESDQLTQMVSVIAHEVRNPLAGVRAAIEVFKRQLQAATRHSAIAAEVVARIDALKGLVDDLLVFCQTPRPQLRDVRLEPLIVELVTEMELRFPVTFRITAPQAIPRVHADPALLRTILLNLMINAAQASSPQCSVEIEIASGGNVVTVSIADEGPGLSAEARAAMFRPFFTTKSRGTGLGLPTARRLVEAHGGTLKLDEHRAAGARLIVSLPQPPR